MPRYGGPGKLKKRCKERNCVGTYVCWKYQNVVIRSLQKYIALTVPFYYCPGDTETSVLPKMESKEIQAASSIIDSDDDCKPFEIINAIL